MTLSVIGAGFGRTGTYTLKVALEQLGFGPCYHMAEVFPRPGAPDLWSAAADGDADWARIFEGFRASVDWPGATFWRELAAAYPEAKIILTVRDPQAWFGSTQATIFRPRPPGATPEGFERMLGKVIGRLFDDRLDDRDHVIGVYERHNAAVKSAFGPERLLVFDVAEGWEPLCRFLGVPVPADPMPRTNSTEEFQARVRF